MNEIILITGDDSVGKDVVADIISSKINHSYTANIKDIACEMYQSLTGVCWEDLNGAEKRIHRPVFSNFCEGIKVTLGKRVFAEHLSNNIKCNEDDGIAIIPDLRFKEEYEVFRENFNVTVIKVIGTSEGSLIVDNLNGYVNHIIDNSGTLENTRKEIGKVLDKVVF